MTDQEQMTRLSELVDGELTNDQANQLLLSVLNDPDARGCLKELLRLRQMTAAWRARKPSRPLVVAMPPRVKRGRVLGRLAGMAVAACVGGVLVLAGVWLGGWLGQSPRTGDDQRAQAPTTAVSAELMQQVGRIFALHESVAGPLAWYAADDQDVRVQVAPADRDQHTPIAVLLEVDGGSGNPRRLVIVCRQQEPAVIDLPARQADQPALRLYLWPKEADGHVQMQYAIAAQEAFGGPASVAGQQAIGLGQVSLGQLALGERVLNVEAAAWPMRERQN